MLLRLPRYPVVLFAPLLLAFSAIAEEQDNSGMLSIILENDLFYNSDRNYTNGIAVIWVPTTKPAPDWARTIAGYIPWFPETAETHHGYAFGQSMYTPSDISLVDPPLDDRPYAGWLYGSIGMGVESGQQLDQLSLTIGIVGPASRADKTQKLVHKIVGAVDPQGWDSQIGNELGIVVTYQHSWRELVTTSLIGFDLDLVPHAGGALGNVYTYLNTGLTLRYGKRLPLDYGPPRIQPSIQGSALFAVRVPFSWYLFLGVEGRAVARNIFLDGNTFRDSRSVDREWLVGDLQWGVVLSWKKTRVSYTHVVRSSEFDSPVVHDDFGAISLSVLF